MPKTPKRPLEIDDLFNIRLVSEPAIAPDDSRVVWVVTRLDRDADTYKAALWIAGLNGSDARQFTSGQYRDTAPAWSPDGSQIAFISNRPATLPKSDQNEESGKRQFTQISLIAPDGGEARQLTSHSGGASSITWSPDSRRIAFVGSDEPEPDDTFTAPVTIGPVADEIVVRDIRYRYDGKGLLKRYSHIWGIDVASREAIQLTHGDVVDSAPVWSPDGRQIAFVGNQRDDRRRRAAQAIQTVSVNGGDVGIISPNDGMFGAISWAPDSTKVAFLGYEDALTGFGRFTRVWTVKTDGTELTNHTADVDITFSDTGMSDLATGNATPPVWIDNNTLLASGSERGATSIYRISLGKSNAEAITADNSRVLQFALSSDGKTLVYVAGAIDQPFRLVGSTLRGKRESILYDPNEDLMSEVEIAAPIELDVAAPDGGKVQTWLLPPHGLKQDGQVKYPLVVQIHGGPHSMYGHGMFHEMQVMAGRGYGVLFCNPRGSSGYGQAFATSTRGAWGESDMPDVTTAVDEASKLDWVDSERLGVTGGSYGGYLTNWIIGHDDRFKAAVTQRCVSNFHSFVGTSDIGFDFGIYEFDGTPWKDAEKLLRYSPISYVDHIQTPLLIIHSEQDLRCPIEQAEQLYTALRYLDREVAFVRMPEEGHELSRSGTPSRRVARLHYLIGWFDSHL
ncbi:MAG: S9 family peptidase [Chloroflexota bacterium]|nr:S9 family peptidase [Chloroflexota bacterium]